MTFENRLRLACAVALAVHASLAAAPLARGTEPPPAAQEPGADDHHEGHHHDAHSPAAGAAPTPAQATQRPEIPDRVLIDQDGKPHRFYSDLVKGKLVVMNSIFTTCAATCPVQTAVFAQVQRLLAERPGRNVQMISVSLDPVTDTPPRLKEFAERYGAKPGWLFLTGPREDVAEVLRAMDLYAAVPKEHTPMAAVGHEPSGLWMKVLNLTAPGEIVSRLDHVETLGKQRLAHE